MQIEKLGTICMLRVKHKGKRVLMILIIQEVQVLKTNIEIKLVNKSLNGNVIIVGRRDILKSTVMTILESKNKRVVHL